MSHAEAPCQPDEDADSGARGLASGCVLGFVAFGAWLRVWRADQLIVFGDEVHSLTHALGRGGEWLSQAVLLHAGGYLPIAAWNGLLLDTIGLSEWGLRLPALLPSLALLCLSAWLALRWLRPVEACITLGWLALAPSLVYLAREGRSYPLAMLAFALCSLAVFRWHARPHAGWLTAAAVAGGAALATDLAVAPSLAALAGLVVWSASRNGRWRSARAGLLSAAAISLVWLAWLGRSAAALSADIGGVRGGGHAGIGTALDALATALGTSFAWAVPALTLAGLGAWRARQRYPTAVAWFAAALLLQLLFLLVMQPRAVELPWVFARYSVHLLPGLVALIAAGVAPPLGFERRGAVAVAAAACALFGLHHARSARYDALSSASVVAHPLLQPVGASLPEAARASLLPRFYREVLPTWEAGGLIEAPAIVSFPLYALYQKEHARPFATAALGAGIFQASFAPHPGLALRRSVHTDALPSAAPPEARYLVVHKQPWREMVAAAALLRRHGVALPALRESGASAIFRGQAVALADDHPLAAALLYDDDTVAVYALPSAP